MKVVNVRETQLSRNSASSGNQIELEIDDQSDVRSIGGTPSDLFCKFSTGFRQSFDSTVNHITSSQIDVNSENGTVFHFDHSVPDQIISIDIMNEQEFQLGKEIVANFRLIDKRGRPMVPQNNKLFKIKASLRKIDELAVDRTLALALLEQNKGLGRRTDFQITSTTQSDPEVSETSYYPDIQIFDPQTVSERKREKQFSKLKKRLEQANSLEGVLRRKKKNKHKTNSEKSSTDKKSPDEPLFDLNKGKENS